MREKEVPHPLQEREGSSFGSSRLLAKDQYVHCTCKMALTRAGMASRGKGDGNSWRDEVR